MLVLEEAEIIAAIKEAIYIPTETPIEQEEGTKMTYTAVKEWQATDYRTDAEKRKEVWLNAEPVRCKGLIKALRLVWRNRDVFVWLAGAAVILQTIYWLAVGLVG